MMRNIEVDDHYLNGRIPAKIAQNLKDFFPEHGDLTYEELLLQQESVYMSIQANGRNKDISSYHVQRSDWSQFSGQEGESPQVGSLESQVALDEALARSLQELAEDLDDILYISEHNDTAAGSTAFSPMETPVRSISQDTMQDDTDPDNMSYEQSQTLGESVGSESRGLSDELIFQLPTFKYKTGFFAKKKKTENEECVICRMAYKNRVWLTTLPCAHLYHRDCITRWLKLNKNCPVCQVEVRGN